jgi:MFS family permease
VTSENLVRSRWLVLTSAAFSFFAVGLSFFAVPPLIPELRELLALSNLQVGLLMGAIAAPAIVFSIPIGAAVDRWPPRLAGHLALLVMLVGAGLFALAPGYLWLIVGRLLFGLGGLVLNLLLARVLTAAFAGRELALAMGVFTAVYPASMILLFSLHPLLRSALGWRGELGVLALVVLAAVPVHHMAMPPTVSGNDASSAGRAWRGLSPALAALGVAWMLFFGVFAALLTFAPEWAGGGSRGLLAATTLTWMQLGFTPAFGALVDRVGQPARWCTAGLFALTAACALMAIGTVPIVLTMVLAGLAVAAVPPAVYALPARLVPPERVGLAFGFITALSNLGTVVGPAAAGALRDATPSWPLLWGGLAAFALVGALVALVVRPARDPGQSAVPLG